ncbi:hypothetical protein ANCDUO_20353, partial [Ancylostoma duodenale]
MLDNGTFRQDNTVSEGSVRRYINTMIPTVFILITLAAIVVHSITLTAIHIFHLYQSIHASEDDPCSVRNTVTFCDPFRYSFSFCVFLMVLNQYFMYVDRLLDTFWTSYKAAQRYMLAVLLSVE